MTITPQSLLIALTDKADENFLLVSVCMFFSDGFIGIDSLDYLHPEDEYEDGSLWQVMIHDYRPYPSSGNLSLVDGPKKRRYIWSFAPIAQFW